MHYGEEMGTFLDDLAHRYGDRRALRDNQVSRDFGEVARRVGTLCANLEELLRSNQFGRGEGATSPEPSLAIFAHNSVAYVELMCAATLLGVPYSPINWHWSVDELAYVLEDFRPTLLFVDARGADVARAALAQVASIPVVISIDDDRACDDDWLSYEDLCSGAATPEGASIASRSAVDLSASAGSPIFYTSGTTGHPKGVSALSSARSSVGAFAEMAQMTVERLGLGVAGRVLLDGPIYHSAQWLFCFLPFVSGFDVVIADHFDPLQTLETIESERISVVHLVPTQFVRILKIAPEVRSAFDLSSLHRVYHGAAPCPISVKEAMLDLLGDDVLWEYYGATESGVVSTISGSQWREHKGSVGKVTSPAVEIVDDNGELVANGTSGLILARPSRAFAYLGDPVKTASVMLRDGMVFVGDIGYRDDDGYLYISDRRIDMIISGGVNIYPAEIESVLYEDPRVVDAAVIGVPDDEYGESVLAVVVLGSEVAASDELKGEILHLARQRLAGYKVPKELEFRPSLPRSLAGKLLKREIREPYWSARTSTL